jgi:catechol 2,3-dioxygenase-like lactoylglutathione lyase family enzyme
MDNVLIVVDDLEAAMAFFTELGMEGKSQAAGNGEPLTASRCPQRSHEAVAGLRVDPCEVGRSEPANETDHVLELTESGPAPVAHLEVLFEALSLAFVQRALEVFGQLVDQVDAGKIVGT